MTAFLLAAALAGPIPCEVIRVLDGDTVEARCRVWPGVEGTAMVRVRGIDTPEKAPRAACSAEAALAAKATAFTRDALPPGAPIDVHDVDFDKYGGRVVATILYDASSIDRGASLADRLVAAGLARPYDGGKKRSWCSP